jgi:NAD(P)-dependent dehydrogenase (short-subunit alcohol dehydrogenase family)
MPWTTSDIPDLTGTVAVVTGANSGVGFESAKAMAGAGAHVVMTGRNPEKLQAALDAIQAAHPEASLEIVEIDQGSLESVRHGAATIVERHPTVDILVNNAGVMAMPEGRTADGFETQFGVNHLGHWVLTADLLPALLAAPAARVVTVTSTAHLMGRTVDPENPNMEGTYDPWRAYGQSKLANYHFALGLQQEFEKRNLAARSMVAHPGLSRTNLQVHTAAQGGAGRGGPFWERMAARWGMEPARGALPQLRAATDPRARGGEMYAPRWVNAGVPVRRPILRPGNAGAIAALWEVSERLTGVKLDFDAAPGRT